MKKKWKIRDGNVESCRAKTMGIMKMVLIFTCCLVVTLPVGAKTRPVMEKVAGASTWLTDELNRLTGQEFLYNHEEIPAGASLRQQQRPVDEEFLSGQQQVARRTIRGIVTDKDGNPLPGVTVMVKGTKTGVTTAANGTFVLGVATTGDVVLQFSFVGMETEEVKYTGEGAVNVTMRESVSRLEDVVVTGIFTRRKESFTGSAQTFTREQLRKVGNTNLVQSLKNIDPSFYIVENILDGSNPNVMPEIQLRGQSGFPDLRGEYQSNPNQPLFILDGFEVDLSKVIDLDMNRVESVTLLKDAAAKAIYGSKAANGVVVIETVRPEAGRMRVSYNGSLDISVPDLTSYDLCNALEKLEVEVAAGYYSSSTSVAEHFRRQAVYNAYHADVLRGVETDWLAQPLRAEAGQKHALYLEGGDDSFRYGINISYNNTKGVMKGSDRNTLSGGVSFSYRYQNISFRNNLDITYNLGENSPWGTFDQYAKLNPYLRPTAGNGYLLKVLGTLPSSTTLVYNPMWNARINTKDFSEYMQVINNTYVEWLPVTDLRVTGRVSITRKNNRNEIFHPASHTDFSTYTTTDLLARRGKYTQDNGYNTALSTDVNASYSRHWRDHLLFVNAGWFLNNSISCSTTVVAEGFPNDHLDDISFARNYAQDTRPTGMESTVRDLGMLGALNYAYADRYLLDLSYRASASSQFGSENRWGSFWSLGAGWNLHHEPFMANVTTIQQLKLRASIGYTGSQGFSSYQSKSTYTYTIGNSYNGNIGAILMGLENEHLRWQRKQDRNIGADIALFGRSLSLRVDYYASYTDALLTDVTIPSSMGFRSYRENLGKVENTGYELQANIRLWSQPKTRSFVNLYAAASHNENRVKKIFNALNTFNEEYVKTVANLNKPVVRYTKGQSMSAVWMVPSRGIDPATGQEIFVRLDGTVTYTWSDTDLAVCGDTEPALKGNTGINADYHGFSLNVGMTWRFGGQVYNQTLVDKVENADKRYNVDRRVFADRWRNPGDVTLYKDIANNAVTRATERFVEDVNEWVLSSVNLSYDFNELAAVKHSGFSRLRLSFNMNDVARVSSVKMERGTAYPFARAFSFSLQAMF